MKATKRAVAPTKLPACHLPTMDETACLRWHRLPSAAGGASIATYERLCPSSSYGRVGVHQSATLPLGMTVPTMKARALAATHVGERESVNSHGNSGADPLCDPTPLSQPPITVAVTGAAGQISYSLLPSLASGSVFGTDQPVRAAVHSRACGSTPPHCCLFSPHKPLSLAAQVILKLLDIAPGQQILTGTSDALHHGPGRAPRRHSDGTSSLLPLAHSSNVSSRLFSQVS